MNCIDGGITRAAALMVSAGALIFALSNAVAQDASTMPMDVPTEVAGIETVCTGVGLDVRADARWTAYSLKVEIAGKSGQYLGDVHVAITKDGKNVLETTCGGPWLLFNLPAGRYQITATVEGNTASSPAYALAGGQGRIILRFPEMGGEMDNISGGNS